MAVLMAGIAIMGIVWTMVVPVRSEAPSGSSRYRVETPVPRL